MTGIVLSVNGKRYEGWKSGSISRSVEAAAGSFTLQSIDKWERDKNPWQIYPGDKCEVEIDGVKLITGYVDSVAPSLSATEHSIAISGRDVTCDIVDCSAVVPSFEIRGQTIYGLASLLCKPFGVEVIDESDDSSVIPVAAVQPGETVFSCLEREARKKEVMITTNGEGALVLGKVGKSRAADRLEQGKNILSASAEYDYSQRYSEYIVKAQASPTGDSAAAWNPPQNAVEARHTDANIKRYRPLIITAESESYEQSAQTRAMKEALQRAGDSAAVSVSVAGWTQSNGELWPLGAYVDVKIPYLYIDDDLIISEITFNAAPSMTTDMTLKRADSFLNIDKSKGKKKKKKSSDKKGTIETDWWGDEG